MKRAQIKGKRQPVDFVILIGTILLVGFGIVMVYSSSYYSAAYKYNEAQTMLTKHMVGVVVGAIAMLVFALVDYRWWARITGPFVLVTLVLLGAVLVFGQEYNGAKRWIDLKVIDLQPGELAKFALILFVAKYVSRYPQRTQKLLRGMWPCLLLTVLFVGLLILQPNFSMVVTLGLLFLAMMIVAQVPGKQLAACGVLAVGGGTAAILLEPYRLKRLMVFLNPWADPVGDGYQVIQSFYAIASGGFFGRGLGFSRQKYLYLPFSESDFIFAIVVEELGFIGAIALFALYMVVIYRGIQVAMRCNTRFGSMLAAGICAMLGIQVIVNVLVVTGSMPPTGLPLPFISYGSTSLVVFMAAVGILLNISRDCTPATKNKRLKRLNWWGRRKKAAAQPQPEVPLAAPSMGQESFGHRQAAAKQPEKTAFATPDKAQADKEAKTWQGQREMPASKLARVPSPRPQQTPVSPNPPAPVDQRQPQPSSPVKPEDTAPSS